MPSEWPEALKQRYKDVGRKVLEAQSISRDDHEKRMDYYSNMSAVFDAPALLIFTIDKRLSLEYAMLDTGLFIQSFCLLAHEEGL